LDWALTRNADFLLPPDFGLTWGILRGKIRELMVAPEWDSASEIPNGGFMERLPYGEFDAGDGFVRHYGASGRGRFRRRAG
jgi:hypothetical protein